MDIDDLCNWLEECVDAAYGTHCKCKRGFVRSNYGCEDDNECLYPNICPLGATCANTFGGYTCKCLPGFRNVSGECEGNSNIEWKHVNFLRLISLNQMLTNVLKICILASLTKNRAKTITVDMRVCARHLNTRM